MLLEEVRVVADALVAGFEGDKEVVADVGTTALVEDVRELLDNVDRVLEAELVGTETIEFVETKETLGL